jgi:DedD protein
MNKARLAMNETPAPETEIADDDALKRRLLNRIAVASVMVVGLLGSLAMFDAIYAPSHPVASKMASLPPQVAAPPASEPAVVPETKPAEPTAAPVAEAKPESVTVAKTEEPAVPEHTASPGAPPLQPLPAEKPLTRPATGRPASIRPSEPVLPAVAPAASPAARPEPARELAHSHVVPSRAPASRPISGAGERQFVLQMGVFGNVANAEDLRAKLELHGIPSSIEARVHVGPFRSKEEADSVRAKLKELGLDGGLLVTLKK